MFKTILYCADGSECALKAAQTVVELAKQNGACVLLLNVHDTTKADLHCFMPWQLETGEHGTVLELNAEQETILEHTARVFDDAGLKYSTLRESGYPAVRIIDVAEREAVDLIVVGSHGVNLLKSLFLGSVSDHIVHNAPCSVLVVR